MTHPASQAAIELGGPLELLFERSGLPAFELPGVLLEGYGGSLGFTRPRLIANFVESLDGVVALPTGGESGQIISRGSQADRFVMGLLRACADAVVVGAGTFRRAGRHLWRADAIYPNAAPSFAEVRKRLGLKPVPTFVLVTASGQIDLSLPAAQDAWIVTTPEGAARLGSSLPAGARISVSPSRPIAFAAVLEELHAEGASLVLTEGGPSLVAELVAQGRLDELFVTVSPALFGRYTDDRRKALVQGADLAGLPLELWSARRHGSHLFLRYAVARQGEP